MYTLCSLSLHYIFMLAVTKSEPATAEYTQHTQHCQSVVQ